MLYDSIYIGNLKNKTNEQKKTKTELKINRINKCLPEEGGYGEEINILGRLTVTNL